MIKSMTGFGSGSVSDDLNQINVDIKAVNSRFLDYKIKGFNINPNLENRIKKELSETIKRGFISIKFEIITNNQNSLILNKDRLESFLKIIDKINSDHKLKINLSDVINLNDVITIKEDIHYNDDKIFEAFKFAIEKLNKMRQIEGDEIKFDIQKRVEFIEDLILRTEQLTKNFSKLKISKIKNKILELVDDISMDESRILQEVAIVAEKSDISEEITRFKIHLNQLGSYLNSDGPVGKKINFMLQELSREVNTLGSKSSDIDVASNVIEIKSELEKIREQNQNIL